MAIPIHQYCRLSLAIALGRLGIKGVVAHIKAACGAMQGELSLGVCAIGAALALLGSHADALLLASPHAAGGPEQTTDQVGRNLLTAINLKAAHLIAAPAQQAILSCELERATEGLSGVDLPVAQLLPGLQLAGEPAGQGLKAILRVAVMLNRQAFVISHFEH